MSPPPAAAWPREMPHVPVSPAEQPQAVSGVPSGAALPAAFLRRAFQSPSLRTARSVLSPAHTVASPACCWLSAAAAPAAPGKGARAKAGALAGCARGKARSRQLLLETAGFACPHASV